MSEPISFEVGSGNVFADLGRPNAEEHHLKARLVQKIGTVMKARGLTQAGTAGLLGIGQAEMSDMLRGQFRTSGSRRCCSTSWPSARMSRSS